MIFKNIIFISICCLLLLGCGDSGQKLIIKDLEAKNDSLNNVLDELNQKYIFDSISIRDIPSHQNTYLRNTDIVGEIVIVGFNRNKKTNVILADSISYDPEIRLHSPDTLEMKNGGFVYDKILNDSLHLRGIIELGNKYGKSHQALYNTVIRAKDD